MTDTPSKDETLMRHVETSAALMDVSIDPAWRDSVLGYFKGMEAAARLLEEFDLPDELDPAPVFSA